jgi:hypothetical protein
VRTKVQFFQESALKQLTQLHAFVKRRKVKLFNAVQVPTKLFFFVLLLLLLTEFTVILSQ